MSLLMQFKVLTINVGSSSVRLHLFGTKNGGENFDQIATYHELGSAKNVVEFPQELRLLSETPCFILHRIVHGGLQFRSPCLIDADAEAEITRLIPLAPLHHPKSLAWIAACRKRWPLAQQIAVFDTAFYWTLPEEASTYALPQALCKQRGLRRFGFHGLVHQRKWERWVELNPSQNRESRVISIHLGSGCSITAIRNGQAIDTSMGFSPLEGLVMATRSGDLDPGLILYLIRELKYSSSELEVLLNEQSGLLGISSLSGDMRDLLASQESAAQLAIKLYCYRIRKYIGSYLAILQGTEAILLSGGVGENAPLIRQRILEPFQYCGVRVDIRRNETAIGTLAFVHALTSSTAVWVIPAEEELMLLKQARSLIAAYFGRKYENAQA